MGVQIANITFDCDDVLKVASFWSLVLGRSMDKGATDIFATIGVGDAARAEPAWFFNKVPEPKQAKNRVHLDLTGADSSTVERLVDLGAVVVGEHSVDSHRWLVMRDPEGNEFCLAGKAWTGSA